MSTFDRLRLITFAAFCLSISAFAIAGAFLGDQIAHSPILWGLGGFVGAITGLVVLWTVQPMIDRHTN